jgi:hypothetical protein
MSDRLKNARHLDGVIHAVESTGMKAPAGCPPPQQLLNWRCGEWAFASLCEPTDREPTCDGCKAATP